MKKKGFISSKKATVIFATAAILISLLLMLLPASARRSDITVGGLYSLSDASVEFLEAVDGEITVYLIAPDGSDRRFEQFMELYESSGDNIKIVKVHDSNKDVLEKYGVAFDNLAPYTMIIESPYRYTALTYDSLFVYTNNDVGFYEISASEYDSYYQQYKSYASQSDSYMETFEKLVYGTRKYFKGDELITSYIEYVAKDVLYTSYVMSGHGENVSSENLINLLCAYYGYSVLDMEKTGGVPEDAAGILINAPTSDISEAEAEELISFIEGGGLVTLITSEANLGMKNLCSVLSAYGMSAEVGKVVVDKPVEEETDKTDDTENTEDTEDTEDTEVTEDTEDTDVANEAEADGEEPKYEVSFTVVPNPNGDHDITAFAIDDELMFAITGGNSIKLDESQSDDPSLLLTPLLTTAEDAYIEGDKTTAGKHVLAAAAETADGGRLVWFTGDESFNFVYNESTQITNELAANVTAIEMSTHWVSKVYESVLGEVSAVLYNLPVLKIVNKTPAILSVLMAVLIPVGVISVGLFVVYKRKKDLSVRPTEKD